MSEQLTHSLIGANYRVWLNKHHDTGEILIYSSFPFKIYMINQYLLILISSSLVVLIQPARYLAGYIGSVPTHGANESSRGI